MVFPIRGRNWCFSRSIDPSAAAAQSSTTPSTVKEFWNKISSKKSEDSKVELTVDFVSNKVSSSAFRNGCVCFCFDMICLVYSAFGVCRAFTGD